MTGVATLQLPWGGPCSMMRRSGERMDSDRTPASLEELYERFSRVTYAFFCRRVGDVASAADLNQELYLRLSRTFDGYEGRSSIETWIFAAARNVLIDARRRRWQRVADREVEIDDALPARLAGGTADDAAERTLVAERLRQCLRRLTDVQRAVVLGHHVAGVTLRELTEGLDIGNPSGARAVLLAAQRALRKCLGAST